MALAVASSSKELLAQVYPTECTKLGGVAITGVTYKTIGATQAFSVVSWAITSLQSMSGININL